MHMMANLVRVTANGSVVDATLWSPSADAVNLVVYDKDDQSKVIGKVAMTKGDKGQNGMFI